MFLFDVVMIEYLMCISFLRAFSFSTLMYLQFWHHGDST